MTHPANGLDDVVHQRVRLGILAIAQEARRVEFGFLRTNLELTAGNLSKHLTVLHNAGLIEIEKGYAGRRGRTWIHLTRTGKQALQSEIAQLKRLIGQIEQTATADPCGTGRGQGDGAGGDRSTRETARTLRGRRGTGG
jgi:DNA-binding MarR family transcriptional regulator